MAKKENKKEEIKEQVSVEIPEINNSDKVVITALEDSKFMKTGKDYKVGGALAKVLIKKGFAKLKN